MDARVASARQKIEIYRAAPVVAGLDTPLAHRSAGD